MLVSNLQEFLRLLAPTVGALGVNASSEKNVRAKLEELSTALEPFGEYSTERLAEILSIADSYHRTGQIPEHLLAPKAPARRASSRAKAPKLSIDDAVAMLRDLKERCQSLQPDHIAAEVQKLNVLTAADLKKVQQEFLGSVVGKTKGQLLDQLQKRIDDLRESAIRSESILNQ